LPIELPMNSTASGPGSAASRGSAAAVVVTHGVTATAGTVAASWADASASALPETSTGM
jgi:hypothetical protein